MNSTCDRHSDISFCTTCMGRLHHVRETLPQNLACLQQWPDCQVVLLDYGSRDGLREWVRSTMSKAIDAGRLLYARTDAPTYFHMSHAKNIAHLLATGRILCNLDADQFVSTDLVATLRELQQHPSRVVTHGRKSSWGRISIDRVSFISLGGYDEEFVGWGYEDQDLLRRASRLLGLTSVNLARFDHCIRHSNAERQQHYPPAVQAMARNVNVERMNGNESLGRLVANRGRDWGKANVQCNFEHWVEVSGM